MGEAIAKASRINFNKIFAQDSYDIRGTFAPITVAMPYSCFGALLEDTGIIPSRPKLESKILNANQMPTSWSIALRHLL